MTTTADELAAYVAENKELSKLYDKLRKTYPHYHWAHIDVFSSFWSLAVTLQNIEGGK